MGSKNTFITFRLIFSLFKKCNSPVLIVLIKQCIAAVAGSHLLNITNESESELHFVFGGTDFLSIFSCSHQANRTACSG